MSLVNAILHQALAQHQVGELQAACDLCRQVLAATPTDPCAFHLFATARAAFGDSTHPIA